jgi:DNA-binding transcriptional MerR regulator
MPPVFVTTGGSQIVDDIMRPTKSVAVYHQQLSKDNPMTGTILILIWVIGVWQAGTPWTEAAEEPSNISSTGDIVRDTKEALETTREYSLQQKEVFEKRVRLELQELQAKIAELRKQTDVASSEARKEMQKAIQDLEKKKYEARKKLDEVNESTSSAWTSLKAGMTAAVEDLKKSYHEALSKFP